MTFLRLTSVIILAMLSLPQQNLLSHFSYDAAVPLDVREYGTERRGTATIHDISYASPKGGRVPTLLVVPDGAGRFAAVIWGHWYWGNSAFRNRAEFLDEAVVLAKSGVVSLLFDGPINRPGFYADRTSPLNEKQISDRLQSILDVRRAADLLLARTDVDPRRLGYVGHSYNASTGGYIAGIDRRFTAFVLMAGSLSDKVDIDSDEYRGFRQQIGPEKFDAFIEKYSWLDPGLYVSHAAPASVFMQYATGETFLTAERARKYAAVVSEPKEFKVYEAPHALNAAARRDRAEFLRKQLRLGSIDTTALDAVPTLPQPPSPPPIQRRTSVAPDGVTIVYSTAGTGDTALVFIHGGMADRTFFDPEFDALSDRYRVIAIDLPGHGESDATRATWDIPQAAADVARVVEAEKPSRVILFGNSLGGPVAIEAALRLGSRVLGVVGIDTFQDIGHPDTPEYAHAARERAHQSADGFQRDYPATMHAMVMQLFHDDADPWLKQEAERRMLRTRPEVAVKMMNGIAGYDSGAAARKLAVPLRAINGDLYPTDIEKIRKVKPDFDVVVMTHMGHYPMLERPSEFNQIVLRVSGELTR